jgi:hypothetical protein
MTEDRKQMTDVRRQIDGSEFFPVGAVVCFLTSVFRDLASVIWPLI